MLVGVQQHPSFSPRTYFDYETFYLVQCFSTVFGILHYRNAQRHVARLYIFSFSRAFLAFGPFWKYTEACSPVIFFVVFMSVFFAFVGILTLLALFLAFYPFSKCTQACVPVIFFFVFKLDLKKVIKVNFRSVVQLK